MGLNGLNVPMNMVQLVASLGLSAGDFIFQGIHGLTQPLHGLIGVVQVLKCPVPGWDQYFTPQPLPSLPGSPQEPKGHHHSEAVVQQLEEGFNPCLLVVHCLASP